MGGIYRSDDAGDSWIRTADDERYWGRGSDFAEVKVDPINADIVYTANVALWKSIDGGKTWNGFRGAPGGDDYHRIWINPEHPEIMLLAADQGAIITVNGGETFSSWYNQPTAQFYHVITDNEFPYNVYGGQQESGSACVSSRSFDGAISYRDWRPVGVEEWGYLAPDPLDPNIIYGGKLTRYDKRTGQTQSIEPYPNGKYQPNKSPWRFLRTAPLIFSPIDKKTLYYAGNVLFKTTSGGMSWDVISPDLSRETFEVPSNIGVYKTDEMKKMPRRGVIYTIAPSPKDVNLIWVGTDDGLIHKTSDGAKTWKNVTPQAITAWSKISLMEAGHFDPQTAYAAVNRIRLDDMKPHIYKTHDGGKTWTEIVKGLPNDPINVVREDHLCKGLLFAGSERAVYYSVDDGENWQSLRNNMPATSIRDLVIKDDDLVVGTHGRSFWILDNITSLRQLTTESMKSEAILFAPQLSYRVRWNTYTDTPIPHEEPAGENPPDGAILDYFIKDKANGVVTLEILDANNELICRYNSDDKPYEISTINHPKYWIRRQTSLSADAGSHRFVWDMKYTRLDEPASYGMSAVHMNTPPESTSPLVMPGQYQVRLTVNGKVYSQSLRIQMDPRVKTSTEDLKRQWELSMTVYTSRVELKKVKADLTNKQLQVKSLQVGAKGKWIDKLKEFQTKLTNFESSQKGSKLTGINNLSDSWATIFGILQDNDNPPTNQAALLVKDNKLAQTEWLAAWDVFKAKEILSFNELLRKDGMRVIE